MTFLVSFGQNSLYVYQEMLQREEPFKTVFLYKNTCQYDLNGLDQAKTAAFETLNIVDMVRAIYHLATSRYVILDNYFGFLAAVQFKEEAECIQLWHAAGAIKKFGLRDQSISNRTEKAQRRFTDVYKKFNKVIVGSEEMAGIFTEAFDLPSESILRTGIPRTDLFYDKKRQQETIDRLESRNPALRGKQVILYAPTFRDHQLDHFEMNLDLEAMHRALGENYVLLLRFHPSIKHRSDYESRYPGFIYDYSSHADVNELLLIADCLITDYSSVVYEYALLNKPMIFFPNDLEDYEDRRGFLGEYESLVPGPVAFTTPDIIGRIQRNEFDYQQIEAFARKWNHYSNGASSRNLVEYLDSGQRLIDSPAVRGVPFE
ncbi:MAG TPA: CDP-glycerol glycerophosphotransferase family protein [Bacillales bacterium]|nr:CDP-glycerol glycerophosphotransferase family protein [Bacillales bacterium]